MQIYTKILIGMAVGAVIGLVAGPNSPLLDKDVYVVRDASILDLSQQRPVSGVETKSPLRLPKNISTRFEILDLAEASLVDDTGQRWPTVVASRVAFEYTADLRLLDRDDLLHQALGAPKVGALVEVWLRHDVTALDSGGFASFPTPVSGLGDSVIFWLSPIGKLFMRLIKMVIVPLVFASLLVGVASLGDVRRLGRLGGRTLGVYLVTTALAVTIGLICAHVIRPGDWIDEASRARLQAQFAGDAGAKVEAAAQAPSMADNILGIIPANPVESLASGEMLQIIFFAVIFGIALTFLDAKNGRPVVVFFDRVQQAMVVIIHMVMLTAPFGVAALIAEVVGTSGASVLGSLLVYGATVIVGLTLHVVLVYLPIVRTVARLRIRDFMRGARPAQLIAFSTSSSSAALPVTMECAEENLGVSNAVSSFVLPLGSTVNMDGTALYQGVAAVFIAQVFQLDLSIGAQLGIVAMATMASIGAAGVPGAGMVTLAMVLTQAGIPTVGVALILGMDRLLDMFRTAVNVTGDLTVTAAMARAEGEDLQPLTFNQDEDDPHRGFAGRLVHEQTPLIPFDDDVQR